MARGKKSTEKPSNDTGLPVRDRTQTGANLGFEAKLWAAADALRNNMDAAEYKAPASEPAHRSEPRIGRNDPCPCGSGKKFKKCCLH